MRIKGWFVGLAILLLAGCSGVTEVEPEGDELQGPLQPGLSQIIAHRGHLEAKPGDWYGGEWENSVQAIEEATAKNVSYIEIDLQLNRHPDAIADANPHGILYVHHDNVCFEINSDGTLKLEVPEGQKVQQPVGHRIEIEPPSEVDKCAERLENVLIEFAEQNFVLEMKYNTSYPDEMPDALYHLLKKRDRLDGTDIVSSVYTNVSKGEQGEEMLTELRGLAAEDEIINLMIVAGWDIEVNGYHVDDWYDMGFRWIAAHVGRTDASTSKGDPISRAKLRGIKFGGWHWTGFDYNLPDLPYITTQCDSAADWAVDNDLDFMMIDCIDTLKGRESIYDKIWE